VSAFDPPEEEDGSEYTYGDEYEYDEQEAIEPAKLAQTGHKP
jgi:hypothetical protein